MLHKIMKIVKNSRLFLKKTKNLLYGFQKSICKVHYLLDGTMGQSEHQIITSKILHCNAMDGKQKWTSSTRFSLLMYSYLIIRLIMSSITKIILHIRLHPKQLYNILEPLTCRETRGFCKPKVQPLASYNTARVPDTFLAAMATKLARVLNNWTDMYRYIPTNSWCKDSSHNMHRHTHRHKHILLQQKVVTD